MVMAQTSTTKTVCNFAGTPSSSFYSPPINRQTTAAQNSRERDGGGYNRRHDGARLRERRRPLQQEHQPYILRTRPQPRRCVIPIGAAEGFRVVPSPGDALRRRRGDAAGGAGAAVRFDLRQVRLRPQRVDRSSLSKFHVHASRARPLVSVIWFCCMIVSDSDVACD